MANAQRKGPAPQVPIGSKVQSLRQEQGITLSDLGSRSGVSISTLSKIENGQTSPTFDTLNRLAAGLGVDLTALFHSEAPPSVNGRRAITFAGTGPRHRSGNYEYELLCADLAHRAFVPLLTTLHARSIEDFRKMANHAGEEFFYVLSGEVVLHTEHYAPAHMKAGDSSYFDSTMDHAVYSVSEEPAQILWIATKVSKALKDVVGR